MKKNSLTTFDSNILWILKISEKDEKTHTVLVF